eukprot:GHRR01006261.1.p1 GENE.GHRR01006261.1~~GHRR01006261.1.p1  ORF type:complete len:631 (+),score=240.17 GHRR01006261.1:87-1979(+)
MRLALSSKCTEMAVRCRALGVQALHPQTGTFRTTTLPLQQQMSGHSLRLPGSAVASEQLHGAASTDYSATAPTGYAAASSDGRPHVCILGGGFGGLYTAIKLELLMWPQGKKPKITLIDQSDRFIFKPLLYELLNGTAQSWEVAPTFTQLLAPYPIQFVQDKVLEVQPEQLLPDGSSVTGGTVSLASGHSISYDWLVVSLGASADPRGVPGVRQYARPFVSLDDAEFVAGRLAAFEAAASLGERQRTLVIVGAGYAGVELASVIGERVNGKAQVMLVTPGNDILETAPAGQRQAAVQVLRSLGVNILVATKVTAIKQAAAAAAATSGTAADPLDPTSFSPATSTVQTDLMDNGSLQASVALGAAAAGAASTSSDAGASPTSSSYSTSDAPYRVRIEPAGGNFAYASTSSSADIDADLVIWTAGAKPASHPLQPFPTDTRGQLQTDPTLRVKQHSRVFALGDVSKGQAGSGDGSASTSYYPATAQVAFQQADYAAWNIWSAINGRALLPFRYQHLGDMMSLGAANAAVALPVRLPGELTSTISNSPLGPLLNLTGIKLDEQQQGVTLEGPLAQLLRRAAYLYRQPTNEQRLNVAASWIQQAFDASARLAAEVASSSGRVADGSQLGSQGRR